MRVVVSDFAECRAGKHALDFLGAWPGTLVCDDHAGYKALIAQGIGNAGCMVHARRKFFDSHVNHQSALASEALPFFGELHAIKREVADLNTAERQRIRQSQGRPVADALHDWLRRQRRHVPEGSAIDYSLNRWAALMCCLNDGQVPIDNNWVGNRVRPVALGRANWLFAGSLRTGERAAAIMNLIHPAKLTGHDPYAHLKNVLERLPTRPACRIGELLPNC